MVTKMTAKIGLQSLEQIWDFWRRTCEYSTDIITVDFEFRGHTTLILAQKTIFLFLLSFYVTIAAVKNKIKSQP